MQSLINYLGCGKVVKRPGGVEACDFIVNSVKSLYVKIIPYFENYELLGAKSKDFEDFCKVVDLMNDKAHLTVRGLDQIRRIKAGMNTGRELNI
jgi:hypothetical protein